MHCRPSKPGPRRNFPPQAAAKTFSASENVIGAKNFHRQLEVYMTELEFATELERVAQAELDAWRNYASKRAELEAAKNEAAEALLDADTAAARRKFSEATQAIALLEASSSRRGTGARRLFATYCHGRVAELRTRAREVKEQAKFIDTERRKFLAEIEKLEGVKIFDPPLAEYDAPRKSDLLRAASRRAYSLLRLALSRPASRAQAWRAELT
jgi:hypothetical protein